MANSLTRMERHILSAFETALTNARWDTAEMLLRAFEASHPAPSSGSPLDRAYLAVADLASLNMRSASPHGHRRKSAAKLVGGRRPADA